MPINVVCPGCHKRFQVSDKFAGQTGPCPQCKTKIKIPEAKDEVVVHEPQTFGPKGKAGVGVLKPIFREETRLTPLLMGIIGGSIAAVVIAALIVRFSLGEGEEPSIWLLGLGAIILAPPVAYSGYQFLRDAELEPHRGQSLMIRVAICSVVYAVSWGIYAGIKAGLGLESMTPFYLLYIAPFMVGAGVTAAFACFDFDFTMAGLHYSFYLLVTVLVRILVMGPVL